MKNLKFLAIAFAALFVSCVNDEFKDPDLSGECTDLTATKSVQDVAAMASSSYLKYVDSDIIEAYVTSSDEGGNFYKSISMVSVDGQKGFSIPIDDYNLYTKYEPGRKVFVNMKDRYIVTEFGGLLIGSLYNGGTADNPADDEVGRISPVEYQSVLTRSCSVINEDEIVNHVTIAQAKSDQYLNKLIEFDNVQFSDESLGKLYYDTSLSSPGGATNHLIKDINGVSVILRASQYATFANQPILPNSGKIRGVMTKYNSDYQFMIRTLNDVKLTNPRIVPFFEETFTTNFPIWTKFSVVGAQVWTLDTTFGNPGSCARISGFTTVNNTNDDWLISPNINTSGLTSAVLSFDNASRFAGNLLEVYISTNYTGGAPNTATWTQLTGATLDTNTGAYVWTNSGGLNISSFLGGNINVAFRYTSTTSASRTWEVDNVKITGN
ncbi:DUF5689 domain-containing protein [Flavobacterium sp.]|uniref:DUF5689 domain-containing protein n=1 Tax=Flavobacterium sp. TaxID=239 RepID=UPI002FDED2E0